MSKPTLPLCDANGNFLPGLSTLPTRRLCSIMWHLAARGDARKLTDVAAEAEVAAGVDWSHRSASNGMGASPLMIAAIGGHRAAVSVLLSHTLPQTSPDQADSDGNTALLAATCRGRTGCVRLLLQAHANPNVSNRRGYTPLEAATDFGRAECVSLLLEAGARPSAPIKPSRPEKGGALQWERGASAQQWWQSSGMPGQTRRGRELDAQLKKHSMIGPDTQLLEGPFDRIDQMQRRHAREVERQRAHSAEVARRSITREHAFEQHRVRVARASLAE
mmetsp:Transcript_86736/g.173105  ORF Transcript_86736/g.173105 Transcript_86736/m.173105 type:complete len:276 (-) Transcript_86736:118-945(-)